MLFQLASHNPDIQKLIDRGYALRLDSDYLVVRDIPYLDAQGNLCWGAIVTVLKDIDGKRVEPWGRPRLGEEGGRSGGRLRDGCPLEVVTVSTRSE